MSLPTGATVVGIKCKDGTVVATDSMITWGTMVLSETGIKAFKLKENVVLASAGLTSDYQMLVNLTKARIKLFELDEGRPLSVKAITKMLASTLRNRRASPLYVQTVIVGVDSDGPALYSLDMGGSLIPDDYTATGTGVRTAYGVLENEYHSDLTVKEAEKIAIKAVKTGIARDVQSGGPIRVMTVTKDGVTESVHEN
ncbi:MAG: proteasome subunit beta [Candidatus Lokiarchaeota archaeon]|nr:proteasome subunit beta [Candidatus Lokiarchaeota archaeon]